MKTTQTIVADRFEEEMEKAIDCFRNSEAAECLVILGTQFAKIVCSLVASEVIAGKMSHDEGIRKIKQGCKILEVDTIEWFEKLMESAFVTQTQRNNAL